MIIFVGDKPSPRMKPGAKPFEGAACEKRLMEWIKVLEASEFQLSNRSDIVPELFQVKQGLYKVVALGNNASKALKDIPHFKLPHPSGKNRQINDKEFIENKLQECREWLRCQK